MDSLASVYNSLSQLDASILFDLSESGRQFIFWFCVFFAVSLILPKPKPGEKPRNLSLVHTRKPIFNDEFWFEALLPFVNSILLPPIVVFQQVFFNELVLNHYVPQFVFQDTVEALPYFLQIFLAVTVLDFSLYVRHRFVHHYAWPYHTVHHSAREISFLTTNRLHPGDMFIMGLIDVTILHVFGFTGEAFVPAVWIKVIFNQINHSNMCFDFGFPLRYILVSPNMHRWHHAADDPKAFNKNYCIVFAWIDVLFGTFYCPPNKLPERYGVINKKGEDVIKLGLWNHLMYPLRQHLKWIRKMLARTQKRWSSGSES